MMTIVLAWLFLSYRLHKYPCHHCLPSIWLHWWTLPNSLLINTSDSSTLHSTAPRCDSDCLLSCLIALHSSMFISITLKLQNVLRWLHNFPRKSNWATNIMYSTVTTFLQYCSKAKSKCPPNVSVTMQQCHWPVYGVGVIKTIKQLVL